MSTSSNTYTVAGNLEFLRSLAKDGIDAQLILEISARVSMLRNIRDNKCAVCHVDLDVSNMNEMDFNHCCPKHAKYRHMFNLPMALKNDSIPLPIEIDIVSSINSGTLQYFKMENTDEQTNQSKP